MSIAAGIYTAGSGVADYADIGAAIADIDAGGLTGDLTIVAVGNDTAISSTTTKTITLKGYTLTIRSAIRGKGKGAPLWPIQVNTANEALVLTLESGVAGSIFEMKDLHFKRTGNAGAAGTPMVHVDFNQPAVDVKVIAKDCLFDLDGYDGSGLYIKGVADISEGALDVEVYNCAAINASATDAFGIRTALAYVSCRIENCVAFGCDDGFLSSAGSEAIYRNCLSFGNSGEDFKEATADADSLAASDGNVSSDGTISIFGGSMNLDYADAASELLSTSPTSKDFMVPEDDSILYSLGLPPAIEDNDTSVEGSARPGSWNKFAAGMVEQREDLRLHWASQRKVTVDGTKIKVNSSSIQLCITQLAPGMDKVLETALADGGDLRVTTDRWGWDELPIEVAQWDPINGKCMIWIKPTAVVAGEDYSCYVWFGNANADQLPVDHDKGQWAVWEDYSMVYHCIEDPLVDLFVKDSSPANHYGLWSGADATTHQDGLADAGAIGKSYRFRETAETTHILPTGGGDFVNGRSFANMSAWAELLSANAGAILSLSDNAGAAERLRFGVTASRVQIAEVLAPDGGTPEIVQSSSAIALTTPIFLGSSARIASAPEKLRWYEDGQFVEEDDISDAVDPFTNTDSDTVAVGLDLASVYFYGKLQELWLNVVDRADGFQETFFENLENGASFFKTPSFEQQDGARGIRFATDEGETYLDATDYFLTYATNAIGDVVMTLNAVWEAVGLDAAWGLSRRHAIEQRLRDLAKMVGRSGKLTLWPDPTQEYGRMTLSSVNANVTDNNTAIIYELTFDPGAAFNVARSLVFKGRRVDASDFLVQYLSADRTVFKPVFRAAPVRIPSGPPAVTISITPLIAIVGAGDTALLTRKKQEEFLKEWVEDFVGEEGTLEIDGEGLGTVHLLGVTPSNMTMPGRASVRMEFATGYGS